MKKNALKTLALLLAAVLVLPLWNELHPEITVEAVRQDSSQYHEMIVTSFGTGASPDVARVDIANIAAYAAQGGLVALSDYPGFAEISADYMDAPLSTNLYQGKYYGLPLDTNCKAAVMNLNVLAELGLDAVPETMEELIEAAAGRGTYTINVSGVGDWDMYPYFWLFGGVLTNDDFTQATGYLDSDEVQSNPVWSVYMAQMESAKARIPSPNSSNIQQIWSDMVTNIFVNGADITAELQNAAALIDEQLA